MNKRVRRKLFNAADRKMSFRLKRAAADATSAGTGYQEFKNTLRDQPAFQELEGGPNFSAQDGKFPSQKFFGGDGNLFSYLGFDRGRKPTQELLVAIENQRRSLFPTPKVRRAKKGTYQINLKAPKVRDFMSLPGQQIRDEGGLSARPWLSVLTYGAPVAGRASVYNYFYKDGKNFPKSASGPAYQLPHAYRTQSSPTPLHPVPFLGPALAAYRKAFRIRDIMKKFGG